MKPLPYTLTLHCQLGCGRTVGEVQLADNLTTEQYRAKAGIVDQRCSQCEIDHGTFKELTEKYMQETGEAPHQAEAFVIENPTRDVFENALAVTVAEIAANATLDVPTNDIINIE